MAGCNSSPDILWIDLLLLLFLIDSLHSNSKFINCSISHNILMVVIGTGLKENIDYFRVTIFTWYHECGPSIIILLL